MAEQEELSTEEYEILVDEVVEALGIERSDCHLCNGSGEEIVSMFPQRCYCQNSKYPGKEPIHLNGSLAFKIISFMEEKKKEFQTFLEIEWFPPPKNHLRRFNRRVVFGTAEGIVILGDEKTGGVGRLFPYHIGQAFLQAIKEK